MMLFMLYGTPKSRMVQSGPEVLTDSELLELVLRRGETKLFP